MRGMDARLGELFSYVDLEIENSCEASTALGPGS
jgi:hypothetical protein